MKRFLSAVLALTLSLALYVPALAADDVAEDNEKMIETTYVTEDGVVVRVFAHKSVDIEEKDHSLIIEGKEYPLEDDLPVEDNLLVTRGANIPTQGYSLRDGPDTQSGSISAGGTTYSNKLYYPSNYNDFKVSFAITAEGNGGKRGEVYLIGVGLYDSQHENRRIYFYDAASISLTGKVSWNCSDTFEDKLTEFCYLRYFGVKDFAVSYNSTVS